MKVVLYIFAVYFTNLILFIQKCNILLNSFCAVEYKKMKRKLHKNSL